MCLVERPSWRYESPVTNSSMVSSPDSSMSSMSHALNSSSCVKWMPKSFICLCTKSFCMRSENSFLSRRPFPSTSASRNDSCRNPKNCLCFCSCSRNCISFRSEVASIMLVEATAVSTEIIVHDAKEMKKTKNNRHQGLISTKGMAMWSQLSVVVNWNNVKSEVGTSWKKIVTFFKASPCSCSKYSRSPRASPCPSRCVSIMAKQRMKRKSTEKIQMKWPNMFHSAVTKPCSLWNILKTRSSRRSRINRRNLSKDEWEPLEPSSIMHRGATQRSKIPKHTIVVSKMAHHLSLPK
mmetsp:Transcript_106622/g.296704  ORF Transcript_106622/g.296704 Transcript_106622/m.296704 type:complete len:294 (-) Transcript_106622:416-1297(-)